jgi:argininosuccinate lyase
VSEDEAKNKAWGGRFSGPTDAFVQEFTASCHFDFRLWRHDIAGSQAHCRMLAACGILTEAERDEILGGLEKVEAELEAGELTPDPALEDIHMHVEARLKEHVGAVAGKLHTARSRNDQVTTDLRLYLREETDEVLARLRTLQSNLVALAEEHVETILPGFTHLQVAQPVSFAHHMLAYVAMFGRDEERFLDCRRRINRLPLGAAALAGTTFPIDPGRVAAELGFDGLCPNSLDAVSDRDYAIEFCAASALTMTHLSRLCEELILWMTPRFGFIDIDDQFCTGSSIMPQKKNPDVPEVVRGKTGRVTGALVSLLTLMKSLPLAYNKDMQEDKEALFDCVDTVQACLRAIGELVPGITPQPEAMERAATEGYSTATDLADYLVRKGIPFRDAHEIVGRIVRIALAEGRHLEEMRIEDMRAVDDRIEQDVVHVLTVHGSVSARKAPGGTAFDTVRAALADVKARLAKAGEA